MGKQNGIAALEKLFLQLLKKLSPELPYDPVTALQGRYPRELKTCLHKHLYTRPGGCPQEPVRAGVGHGRAGRGLGWGWGPGVAARSPRGCDVSAGGPAPARHLCPGRCPWCHPAGSALPARGSMPRIRPPTALMRAWHPCIGTAAGRGGGNHGNGYSASLPALQPRPVLVAAEARSLPPLSPHMC